MLHRRFAHVTHVLMHKPNQEELENMKLRSTQHPRTLYNPRVDHRNAKFGMALFRSEMRRILNLSFGLLMWC